MEKDYKKWHAKKTGINEISDIPFFHERDIRYCFLGSNVGFEQDGGKEFLRPVVILKKFNNNIFWGIPLTKTTDKKLKEWLEKFYYNFSFVSDVESSAILTQVRLLDAKRLSSHIGTMSEADFKIMIEKIKALLP